MIFLDGICELWFSLELFLWKEISNPLSLSELGIFLCLLLWGVMGLELKELFI